MNLQLSKRGLTECPDAVLRVGLLISAAFVVGIFVVSVPTYLAQLRTVCAGPGCNTDQLTVEGARALRELGFSVSDYAAYFGGLTIASALVWFGVAALIAWRRFDDRFALFVALTLVLVGAFSVTGSVDAGSSSWWLAIRAVSALELVCFMLFLCIFPDGRFVPRWTRWVALGAAALGTLSVLLPDNPLGPLWFGFAGTLVGAQVYRYRRVSTSAQRQQTKWVIFAVAMVVLTVVGMFLATQVFSPSDGPGVLTSLVLAPVASVILLLVPLSIGIAILRYRLFDIDLIINRTLVYGTLTACIVGIYVLVVGYLGAMFRTGGNLAISLVATGIVAVLFAPLRDRLQRGVNRLTYGERDDPYRVLSRLGQRLEATLDPHAVLPAVAEMVTQALKLPHVAIELKRGEEYETAAEYGRPAGEQLRLPLIYGTETVGRIVLSPRGPGESFGPADHLLLGDLARQVGAAAHAVRLTDDLQRSRERLVTAREEERRRLRRNLHDGLGPALSSAMLKLGAARRLLPSGSPADDLIVEVREDMRATVADVRGLVYNLRPPVLDQLGLVPTIRDYAEQCTSKDEDGMHVTIDAPEQVPPLPAAVEVAAYYIAREAITNTARHARARSCRVHLALQDGPERAELRLEITDDGVGLPDERHLGVGLSSMRERAEELGGEFSIESPREGGTRVVARLPVGKE